MHEHPHTPQEQISAVRFDLRPLLFCNLTTTIAMAAGMLPSAYGVGDGGEFRAPMAIAWRNGQTLLQGLWKA